MKHFEDNDLHITFTFERYDFKSLSLFAVLLDWFRNNSIKLFKCRLHLTFDAKAIFEGVRESTINLTQWVYFDKDGKTSIAAWKLLVDVLVDSSYNPRKILIKHTEKYKNVKMWDFLALRWNKIDLYKYILIGLNDTLKTLNQNDDALSQVKVFDHYISLIPHQSIKPITWDMIAGFIRTYK